MLSSLAPSTIVVGLVVDRLRSRLLFFDLLISPIDELAGLKDLANILVSLALVSSIEDDLVDSLFRFTFFIIVIYTLLSNQ